MLMALDALLTERNVTRAGNPLNLSQSAMSEAKPHGDTDRIATITMRLAAKYAEELPLRLLPLPIAMPPMVEMLQWHKVHEYDPAHHWFRGLLRMVAQRLPPRPPVIRGGRAARVSVRS